MEVDIEYSGMNCRARCTQISHWGGKCIGFLVAQHLPMVMVLLSRMIEGVVLRVCLTG